MNIQIFGRSKSFDTKKAERYFKERKIPFQSVDLKENGLSRGELESIVRALGGLEPLIDPACKDKDLFALFSYLTPDAQEEKLLENPILLRAPIVRNGRAATVGYCPEIWKDWK